MWPRRLTTAAVRQRPWCVLGVETSCDDTGVAVVRRAPDAHSGALVNTILAERVVGQCTVHEDHGGVVPRLAAAAHARVLPDLVRTYATCMGKRGGRSA
jgi:N6-L-threonylcarbamoyladenine synthase